MRQCTLTMKRANNTDKGCEYYRTCLRCRYKICIKHELTDKQRQEYLDGTPKKRRTIVAQVQGNI